jgi:cytochrome c oxidase subunit II
MMGLLVSIVVVLGIITFAQLIKVFEVTKSLKGGDDHIVTDKENRNQATLMFGYLFVFFAFCIWTYVKYGQFMLPEAASVHGEKIDTLLGFNFLIIILAFIITHVLLFYFAFKYQRRVGGKADFITHNNKLELVWTTFPAIVLAVIIIYGISTWNEITRSEPENALTVELYAKQFDWTARFPGEDGQLGEANYRLISGTNPMGLITDNTLEEKLAELNEKKAELDAKLMDAVPDGKIAEDTQEEIWKVEKHINKLIAFQKEADNRGAGYISGFDDKPVKVEFHLPVDEPIKFQIRAQDVIHSAYMPHFRAQMNAVPGMVTSFYFTPNKTTEEMRLITKNPEFDYLLYCNKICGSAHYNMQMKIVIESREKYEAWLNQQPVFYAEGLERLKEEEFNKKQEVLASKK